MSVTPDRCADLHGQLQRQPRYQLPPPFTEFPLNGVYFIFETGEQSHNGFDRIVRVGSHRGRNNLLPRLRQHITPHGRSSFRYDVGRSAIENPKAVNIEPIDIETWDNSDTIPRNSAETDARVQQLDRFETQLSAYIAKQFQFSVIGTREEAEALQLEKACIATVAQCAHCKEVAKARLRPRNGFLWNTQHTATGTVQMTDQQWLLRKARL